MLQNCWMSDKQCRPSTAVPDLCLHCCFQSRLSLKAGFIDIDSEKYIMLQLFIQSNLSSSNLDGSFTMANSTSILSSYEILSIAQENIFREFFSHLIMKLYVVCTL